MNPTQPAGNPVVDTEAAGGELKGAKPRKKLFHRFFILLNRARARASAAFRPPLVCIESMFTDAPDAWQAKTVSYALCTRGDKERTCTWWIPGYLTFYGCVEYRLT